ncbi:hypothetical protein DL768_007770 [Monosporascus sp. mg162]|nr:hypothetical protein DL768_007770 [Monosporascus sp. mg162]
MSESNTWRATSDWRSRSSNDSSAQSTVAGRPSGSWRNGDQGARPSQRQPDMRWAERPRPQDVTVHRPQAQKDEPDAEKAIAEGRRIYLGNLQYQATPEDIEGLLAANGLAPCEKIHISIDPFTGRNPGYCFLEFGDRETAETAMTTLEGKTLLDRPVKCRPCQPKGSRRRYDAGHEGSRDYGSGRWGDWRGARDADGQGSRTSEPYSGDRPHQPRREADVAAREGRQLYVGGLPRMLDQAMNDEEIRDIFKDFEVENVSKRISPDERKRTLPGRHNFCFVNFSTPEQAKMALEAVNGTTYRGDQLKVSLARGFEGKS